MKPRLFIEQKLTVFANQYRVYGAGEEGAKASLLAFAQQKRLSLKEKVTFYSAEDKSQEIFTFRAEKVLDVHGRYLVEDHEGVVIGSFRKVFGASLFNSTWVLMDREDRELFEVSERSTFLALLRRFGEFVPIVGDLVKFFRYHFKIVELPDRSVVAGYEKTALLRDRYTLSTTNESFEHLDWRVWASLCVALDALQSR
jgi:uncharacterized protein YxjI